MNITDQILKIAKLIQALDRRWIRVKDSQTGWKRKNERGEWIYRYQDTDPNIRIKEEVPEITHEDKKIVERYTNSGYVGINKYLRFSKEKNPKIEALISNLNSALDKLPDHEGTVYRGVDFAKNKFAYDYLLTLKTGDVIHSSGFLSSTQDSTTAQSFAGFGKPQSVLFIIKSKHGKSIEQLSPNHQDEREVLFKLGTNFKIISIAKEGHINLRIELEETDQPQNKIPIKDMSPESLRIALIEKNNFSDSIITTVKKLSEAKLQKIIDKLIKKHGPYYVI